MHSDFEHVISRRGFLKAAGTLGAAGLLASCGGSGSSSTAASAGSSASGGSAASGEPLKEFISWRNIIGEIETWNMLYAQGAAHSDVITNLWDGLISYDTFGKVVPAIAKSWDKNSDSTVWTYHLRDDVDWCDVNGEVKAHLTSEDFLVGLEWVLNFAKNQSSNTSMPLSAIEGAEAYYNYTKGLVEGGDEAAARALTYKDMLAKGVGISAPDDYTVEYTCFTPTPYFETMVGYCCFYPAPTALVDELGVDGFFGMDYTNMWYCGPYLIEEFIQGNTKSFVPNPNWYAASEFDRFERVTVTMISDSSTGTQLYQNRELDEIDIGESTLTSILDNPDSEYYDQLCEKRPTQYSYSIHFNYNRLNSDGSADENWNKAVANTAFRQCFNLGLDLTDWYARYNKIHPLRCECNYYTMKGVCFTSDGADYTRLVAKQLGIENEKYDGETMIRLRGHDITDLKKQAMDELSAIGVTFPVHINYYIPASSTSSLDTAQVLKQCISESFGDDFMVLDINTYVSALLSEVITPQLQSIYINGWGADFGDPVSFLTQEVLYNDNAYYTQYYSNVMQIVEAGPADYQQELIDEYDEFTRLVDEASAVVDDTDKRYEAFAVAEAYMIDKALTSPCWYDVPWCLTHANEYSKIYAMYGVCNYRYLNWETSEEAYTTEQYEEFAAAYEAATT